MALGFMASCFSGLLGLVELWVKGFRAYGANMVSLRGPIRDLLGLGLQAV